MDISSLELIIIGSETGSNCIVSELMQSRSQGWAANSTPGIYHWHLPVFTGLENTPQVANTGRYWQIDFFFALNYSENLK